MLADVLDPVEGESLGGGRQDAVQARALDLEIDHIVVGPQGVGEVEVASLARLGPHRQASGRMALDGLEVEVACLDHLVVGRDQGEAEGRGALVEKHQRVARVIVVFLEAGVGDAAALVADADLDELVLERRVSLGPDHRLGEASEVLAEALGAGRVGEAGELAGLAHLLVFLFLDRHLPLLLDSRDRVLVVALGFDLLGCRPVEPAEGHQDDPDENESDYRVLIHFLLFLVSDSRFHEAQEKRVRVDHGAVVLRMVLDADEPFQRRDLDRLDKARLRVLARAHHAGGLELALVLVVELEAVAVALLDVLLAVGLEDFRAGLQVAIIGAEAHGAAHVGDVLLLFHEVDHLVGRVGFHLGGVGVLEAYDVAGELDHHALHAQADAQAGDVVLASVFDGGELALDAALAEARGDQEAVHVFQLLGGVRVVQFLGVEEVEVELVVVIDGRLEERLVDRLVGVLQLDVFADEADVDRLRRRRFQGQEFFPRLHLGRRAHFEAGFFQDDLVHLLPLEDEGHLVDRRDVDRLDDGVLVDVAEEGHLAQDRRVELVLGAEDEDVGLDAQLLELLDGVLRRLRLVFLRGGDVGDVGEVHAEAVLAQLPLELADALDEGERLDVAHRAADLGDHEVEFIFVAQQLDVALDLVGDVGDDLHGAPQVVAPAFLVDDALVDAPGGDVVGPGGRDVEETLVVPQVEIGLVPVDGHVAFPVLVGVERAGVDVDVGVELLDGHFIASGLEELAQ